VPTSHCPSPPQSLYLPLTPRAKNWPLQPDVVGIQALRDLLHQGAWVVNRVTQEVGGPGRYRATPRSRTPIGPRWCFDAQASQVAGRLGREGGLPPGSLACSPSTRAEAPHSWIAPARRWARVGRVAARSLVIPFVRLNSEGSLA
jgi:hypothetical protein